MSKGARSETVFVGFDFAAQSIASVEQPKLNFPSGFCSSFPGPWKLLTKTKFGIWHSSIYYCWRNTSTNGSTFIALPWERFGVYCSNFDIWESGFDVYCEWL